MTLYKAFNAFFNNCLCYEASGSSLTIFITFRGFTQTLELLKQITPHLCLYCFCDIETSSKSYSFSISLFLGSIITLCAVYCHPLWIEWLSHRQNNCINYLFRSTEDSIVLAILAPIPEIVTS
jgi:hypothetical protein